MATTDDKCIGSLTQAGVLEGHRGWVTALACPTESAQGVKLISASRDKTLLTWTEEQNNVTGEVSLKPLRRLEGHSDFVSNIAVTTTGDYAISSSWDQSLRLWNLNNGSCDAKFHGHTNDVLDVAISPDNRHIVSVGRDKIIRSWNVRGVCVGESKADVHSDWISCVSYTGSSEPNNHFFVTGSWDKTVKIWSKDLTCIRTLEGNTDIITDIQLAPDGSLVVSGSNDGKVFLWETVNGELLNNLFVSGPITKVCFTPQNYLLTIAIADRVEVWDMAGSKKLCTCAPEKPEGRKSSPKVTCFAWSPDTTVLYVGYDDNRIICWNFNYNVRQ